VRRPKQPYRAPEAAAFFGTTEQPIHDPYAEDMLSTSQLKRSDVFRPSAVERLVRKARAGRAIGAKDNMALVGILSTQILVDRMIHNIESNRADSHRRATAPDIGCPVVTTDVCVPDIMTTNTSRG
jgi:asparagine synthase (glutamine-hydrolysing)